MNNSLFLKEMRDIIGKTGFVSDREHALYGIHKCFDVIIKRGLLSYNNKFTLSEDETVLKLYRIIPPVMDIKFFFRRYDKIWSQEHKCWFNFKFERTESDIKIEFEMDNISPPEKIYIKEKSTPEMLKEYGLNKWKKGS